MDVPPSDHHRDPFPGSRATQDGVVYPLATWRARAGARLIDLLVVALPGLLLAFVTSLAWVGTQMIFDGSTRGLADRFPFFLAAVFFVLYTGYETFALSRWQQTIGKRQMGVKVAPVAGVGRLGRLRLPAAMVRSALFVLPVLLFMLPTFLWWSTVVVMALLTGGMAAWNLPNHQGLHDKVAGTIVLDVS